MTYGHECLGNTHDLRGCPTTENRGRNRRRAGAVRACEPLKDVAHDFGLKLADVLYLNGAAA